MTHRRVWFAAGLGFALWAAACHNDVLNSTPVPPYVGGAMFQRYVAMGNSITMGIQSAGINDSTQQRAYPVLVAAAMRGDRFYYPSLVNPGCPPPYANVFTTLRVSGDTVSTRCFFRSSNLPPYISNVAVSGAEVLDLLKNGPAPGTNSNPLTQLALGGRTQIQALMDARPTFVSAWIGNNDLLAVGFASDTNAATDTTSFRTRYQEAADSIQRSGARAILIGVGLGSISQGLLPFWSRGSIYYGLYLSGAFAPAPFSVAASCAPPRGDSVWVPFPFGLGLINTAKTGTPTALDCTEPQTVQPAEYAFGIRQQAAYNAIIQSIATAHDWAYTDVNAAFDSLRAVPGQINPFPAVPARPDTLPKLCYTPPGTGIIPPFGAAFSCDGIHPSSAAHQLIAKKVVQAINAKYNSAIPPVVP